MPLKIFALCAGGLYDEQVCRFLFQREDDFGVGFERVGRLFRGFVLPFPEVPRFGLLAGAAGNHHGFAERDIAGLGGKNTVGIRYFTFF